MDRFYPFVFNAGYNADSNGKATNKIWPYPAITATADTSISMRGKHLIPVLIILQKKH